MTSAERVHRMITGLTRLFNRDPDARRPLNRTDELAWLLYAYIEQDVKLRLVRISSETCMDAILSHRIPRREHESFQHQYMKLAAVYWMREQGAADANSELTWYNFRVDAMSRKTKWIVECGNTPMRKLKMAVMEDTPPRFTLIPFQDMADDPLYSKRLRPLLGVDFTWSPALTKRLQEDPDEAVRELDAKCGTLNWGYPPLPHPGSLNTGRAG